MTVSGREQAVQERAEKATPGPWDFRNGGVGLNGFHPNGPTDLASYIARDEDAAFIAHAREDVPWLLNLVDELTAALRDALSRLETHAGYLDPESFICEIHDVLTAGLAGRADTEEGGR